MAVPPNAVQSSSSSLSTSSATGNPRNKVALLPGYSLMDWIRLGNSGKDLTGVGGVAKDVTEEELAAHNLQSNAWLVIRGKVYNVAPYMNFHPGGIEEMMRGAGKDATKLFTEIHPWVNYESILQKCFVGRLVKFKAPATSLDLKKAFFDDPEVDKKNITEKGSPDEGCKNESSLSDSNIKMCWCQTLDKIKFIFLCKVSSPHILIKMLPEYHVRILIRIKGKLHVFSFQLEKKVDWPCSVKMNTDTGRLEVEFTKETEGFWDSYGVDDEDNAVVALSVDEIETYHTARVVSIDQATHNVRIFVFKFVDNIYMWVPIGHDMRIRTFISGIECAKQYTVISPYLCYGDPAIKKWQNDHICFMIKYYEEGTLTPYLFNLKEKDVVDLGGMSGTFSIRRLNHVKELYLIAAGSGISPMLRLLVWAARRRDQLKSLRLLFVNRYEKDIIWKDKIDELAAQTEWLEVTYCLSQPGPHWEGLTGRVNEEILNDFLPNEVAYSNELPQFYICACGPITFTEMIQDHLNSRGYASCSHCFLG